MPAWISSAGPTLTTVLGAFIAALGAFSKSEHDLRSKIYTAFRPTRMPAFVILIGALLSVIGAIWSGQNQTASAIQRGQFEHDLRVKSDQIATLTGQIAGKSDEIAKKSEEIASLNREIAASVTGGNEFAFLDPLLAEAQNRILLILVHRGSHPIYDVGFRVLDLRVGSMKPAAEEMLSNTFSVGTLAPSERRFVAYWPLVPGKNRYGFNFFFTARNSRGFTIQQVRFAKVNEEWVSATDVKLYSGGKALLSRIDPKFPKGADGQIDWNAEVYSDR